MIKELNVFPHNMAACCPLIVGDIVFVVTANGVDEGHINIPSPDAPSFIALDKNTGKLLWKNNSPGKNIMHGQWSNPTYAEINGAAGHLPRRRRLAARLRARDRQADLEVRLQPEGRDVRTRRHRHQERLHRHAGRLRRQGLHRRRPGPGALHRHRPPLVHRPEEGGRVRARRTRTRTCRRSNDNFDPNGGGEQGLGAGVALRRRGHATPLAPARLHLRPDA